ncbi:LacI family DNA-binding transcriptional regulator [Pseudothermotoga lettingae]|uniref:Alanine racemase n=2 Tax=Pseudothermotoga TaxID=1643951 RepID=A8F7K2_PSELT|nr:LacI family DNA-binding transcriptional regulator [Pseudothermotoga lettingae]ABV34136.1 Alanine racemase [Pseudothermotoga lettingae TMO]KUK20833.1 MAG: Alanine racemase [Pseudothermotoga lettingae]GLI48920.1 LacI family transcriptional regulator [Pseudothermotoga lettingae TMO]
MKKYVTMKDIAKRAGVSVNTVSKALRGKDDISKQTRQKILKIAREIGYIKNTTAFALRRNQTKTVGVVIEDSSNPFFAEVLKGIEAATRKFGYQLLLMNTETDPKTQSQAITTLLERRVEGLLISPFGQNTEDFEKLLKMNFPFVLIGRHMYRSGIDEIYNDEIKGGYLATKHLIFRNRKRILFINTSMDNSASIMRYEGYKKALSQANIELSEDYLITAPYNKNMEAGYMGVKEAIKRGIDFDSIFCYNDMFAFGAIKALDELGKKVPEDIAVVGYDDICFASYFRPPLTTVQIKKYEMGFEAFKILLERITGKRKSYKQLILDVELVVRQTS